MFENAEFVTWANENVVMLVAHPKGSHKTLDVAKPAKGEPNKTCSMYPGISCEEHEKVFAEATGRGGDSKDDKAKPKPKPKKDEDAKAPAPKLDVKGFPTTYVINPDGTFEVMKGDREPASCRSGLEEYQKKLEEHPLTLAKWTDIRKDLADGEKALKASTWKLAYAAFQKIDAACAGTPPKALLETLKARFDTIDAKIAARAGEIAKGPGDEAAKLKLLKALRADYPAPLSTPLPSLVGLDASFADAAAPGAPAPTPATPATPAMSDLAPGPTPAK